MDSEISNLKTCIEQLRATKGARAKIPHEVWSRVANLSQTHSLKDICQKIGINSTHARIKIQKKASNPLPKGLIQLETSPNPVLELTLRSGAIIKVFEQ